VTNQSDVRIAHDRDQVNNILATISELNNLVPVPIKVIRISRYPLNKPRPLIITLNSISEAFNIMKNNISNSYPDTKQFH